MPEKTALMNSLMICNHQMLLGWSYQGWDGWGTWHMWRRW